MTKVLCILLAFLAGAFLPVQAGLNSKLGKFGESPVHASMLSFAVGMVGLIAYLVLTAQSVSWSGMKSAPVCVWSGGLMGAL